MSTTPAINQVAAFPRWAPVVLALLLGFALVVVNLDQVSLWSDEGWTIAASENPNPAETITEWALPDVHPPLYFIALSGWRVVTGDTIFEMRYFSVLVTMFGIAFAYRLGKALFGGQAGLLAAAFYALHDLVRVLTQEVRHYPGQMALAALAMWLYWRFYQKPTIGRGLPFAIAGAALLYTHYWGGFLLLGLALHALITLAWKQRDRLIRHVAAFAAIGLLWLPWLPALIHQVTLERPQGLPHALENTNWVMRVLLYQLLGVPEQFWLVFMGIGLLGTLSLRPRRWKPTPATLMPALVVIIPPLLTIAINTTYPVLSFRALAVIVPAAMVLAAHGVARFRPPERAAVAIFIVFFSLTSVSASAINRPDWPTIADTIARQSDSTDVTLLENDTDEHALAYYLEQTGADVDYARTEHVREFTPSEYESFLNETLEGHDGVWIAKLGWPAESGDIRPTLRERGFVQSAPERDYGMYDDRPILLWRMDRMADDEAPVVTYGDAMQLYDADVFAAGGTLTVNLLWKPDAVPAHDYTVSVLLFGPDGISNRDSRPMGGDARTTTWQPGEVYFDSYAVATDDLTPGTYRIGVQVYHFTDADFTQTENAPADDCSDDEACRFVYVGEVQVGA